MQRVNGEVSRKLKPGIVALDNKMVPLSSPLGRSYNFCDGPLHPLQPPRFSSPISLLPFASYVCVRVYISKGFGQEALLRSRKERGRKEKEWNWTDDDKITSRDVPPNTDVCRVHDDSSSSVNIVRSVVLETLS